MAEMTRTSRGRGKMTIADLKHILSQCVPSAEVLIRLDDEATLANGLVFEIVGHEYGYGCTESLALMLECGQPDTEHSIYDAAHVRCRVHELPSALELGRAARQGWEQGCEALLDFDGCLEKSGQFVLDALTRGVQK